MEMKIHIATLLLLCVCFSARAQNESETDDLSISVVVPQQIGGLTNGQLSKLKGRMLRMVSNYGIAGEGLTDKFILYPRYEIYDHKVVEGLQNVHVIDVELDFVVKEVKTGKVYSIYTQEITGDGYSKKEAINQSISQVKTRGEKIKTFLQAAKTKILSYYRQNCDRLHDEASVMIKQKRYSEAIALLYPVPKEVGGECYKKIQRKLDEAYEGYLNKTCEKNLVRAKAAISKNNNETALEILGSIETESNCHPKAQKLRAEIKVKAGITKTSNGSETETGTKDESAQTTTDTTHSEEVAVNPKPRRQQKRKKMKAIAQAEFKRTRHQGEIDRAIQEG